jgi:hypothetical protein
MRNATRAQLATLAIIVLIPLAGCRDTPAADPGGADQAGEATQGAPVTTNQPVTDFDLDRLCTLLELSEIEAEFGQYGSVSEGTLTPDLRSCDWLIGDQSLQLRVLAQSQDPQARLVSEREALEADDEYEIADVNGVGDYAYVIRWEGTTQLVFLTGGQVFYLYSFVSATDELTTLAGHVTGRV